MSDDRAEEIVYRVWVTHLLQTWVGVTLIWDVPPSCPAAQPALPVSHQPRQNQAEGGTAKIIVNPTQVRQEMGRPVFSLLVVSDVMFSVSGRDMRQDRRGQEFDRSRPLQPRRLSHRRHQARRHRD